MTVCDFRQAKLIQDLIASGATVEDLARGYAAINGDKVDFDKEKNNSIQKDSTGHYLGYVVEMESIIDLATTYAQKRGREIYPPS